MKNIFSEHIRLGDEELKSIWKDCLFVFDTNVLLNFYRYSDSTSLELKNAINYYRPRIWIPHQVGVEFFKNRFSVILEQRKNYSEPLKNLRKIKEVFSSKKGHPFITDNLLRDFNGIIDKIEEEFDSQQEMLLKLINHDPILDSILELFDGSTGNAYSKEELAKIYNQGRERYKNKIPPGFGDLNKPEPDRYGDFIVWKQMLDKALANNVPIVFVSDDEKEDWIQMISNKTIGPLPHLIKEFKDSTNNNFYVYQTFRFLKYAYEDREEKVDQPAVDEIKYIASSVEENNLFNFHQIEFFLNKENASQDISGFYNDIRNQGYILHIENMFNNVEKVSLNVPFKDLVRRFYKILIPIMDQYNLLLISFSPAPS